MTKDMTSEEIAEKVVDVTKILLWKFIKLIFFGGIILVIIGIITNNNNLLYGSEVDIGLFIIIIFLGLAGIEISNWIQNKLKKK